MLIVITAQGDWMMVASTVETVVAKSGAYAVVRARLDTRGQSLARVVPQFAVLLFTVEGPEGNGYPT